MQDLKKEKFRFIVIGGWAAYLWTKLHKSKDVDIILPKIEELDILKRRYPLQKNDRLKKYEVKFEEIDLDIYVPYYSKLTLPIENITKLTTVIEGFTVVAPEVLLILKQGAELDRKDSVKGQKDRIDIMALLFYADIDFMTYRNLLEKYKLSHFRKRLLNIVKTFTNIKHLNLNLVEFTKRKKKLLCMI